MASHFISKGRQTVAKLTNFSCNGLAPTYWKQQKQED